MLLVISFPLFLVLTEEEDHISEDFRSLSSSSWFGIWVALSASKEVVKRLSEGK